MKRVGWWTRWVLAVLLAWIVLVFGIFWAIPAWMNLSPGDSYALGQLVLEAILLPVAVLGFVWTYRQIRNALLPERLDLAWNEGEERPPKRTSILQDVPPSGEREGKQVCLVNQGSSIARWFVIEISLPVEICLVDEEHGYPDASSWEPSGATEDGAWEVAVWPDSLRVTFTSNGSVGSFPNVRLPLGTVWHTPNRAGLGDHDVPYTIHTERGDPVDESLVVNVESALEYS